MDVKKTLEAIKETAEQKNISEEAVLEIVKEALRKGFIKKIKGDDDAYVEIVIDEAKNKVYGIHKRFVVPNDYMTDYIDIRLEDALLIDKKAKIDGEITQKYDLTNDQEVGRGMALAIKTVLSTKLAEAEKAALFERFQDKKGEMITGTVERFDGNSCTVKITNGPSISLLKKDLIGDETFNVGDPIRLYVSDVSETNKGNQLKVTRANEGFLKSIFAEEIHEIYDGTVVIKGIARIAGIRSKISVISEDDNVDPIGAIIGQGGTRISRVIKQLGNGNEKIDVFIYNDNPALYIVEALRPAQVKGIYFPEDDKKAAVAVVEDGQSAVAFGKKAANIRLASKITGYNITIYEEKEAIEKEIPYKDVELIKQENEERIKQEKIAKYLKAVKEEEEKRLAAKAEAEAKEKEAKEVKAEEVKVEETKATETKPVETEATETKPEVKEEKPEKVFVEVKTTQSLDDLEKELSQSTAKAKNKPNKTKRPKKITDEELGIEKEEKVNTKQGMAIYTEEELAQLEEEELEEYDNFDKDDEDVDYDQYDKYYEE